MAKNTQIKEDRKCKKRKGIHAKTKMSKLKQSKNYFKRYNRQGKWAAAVGMAAKEINPEPPT